MPLYGYSMNIKLKANTDLVIPDGIIDALRAQAVRTLNLKIPTHTLLTNELQGVVHEVYFEATGFDGEVVL